MAELSAARFEKGASPAAMRSFFGGNMPKRPSLKRKLREHLNAPYGYVLLAMIVLGITGGTMAVIRNNGDVPAADSTDPAMTRAMSGSGSSLRDFWSPHK